MVAVPLSGGVHFGSLAFSLASNQMGESSMHAGVRGQVGGVRGKAGTQAVLLEAQGERWQCCASEW